VDALKACELCGIENPDEARFCMKCGRDLDKAPSTKTPPEMQQDLDTFTPLEDDEFARLAPTRRLSREPVGDVASYKEAAAASAAAWEAEQEQAYLQEQAAQQRQEAQGPAAPAQPSVPEGGGASGPAEAQPRRVSSDFKEQKQFCHRCGMANPRDQRFCKNCGSAMASGTAGIADRTYDAADAVPLASVAVETTMLADVSHSSAYSTAEAAQGGHRPRERHSAGALSEWGAREWLGLIIAALVGALALWFAFFGGYNMLFNASDKDIHKAGATMEKLPSFQYGISATFETEQGQFPGGGHAMFETPDRSAWEVSRSGPGTPKVQGTVQVGKKPYTGAGGAWQPADPATATGDITQIWKNFSKPEALPNQPMGASPVCLHYKYRTDPDLVMTVLGLGKQDVVSDAVMEIWIDKASFQVIRETAQIFNAQIDGIRTSVTLVLDLTETGKPYQIQPPM
jgi:ribosomal protein L40E